ncbi:PREDICTED: uncharacterized protein LOC104608198 [Nelumbo nucifera]|uniref:Uncharacterized protein LOC104608198 n=1 Tax=Nelumbo nucifera TaxID=4432 RepID=A0A1U8B8R8_NELNU|nr:PREDICTED: uncharacterized protein LOC104608198 [Nelumbo nucifera]
MMLWSVDVPLPGAESRSPLPVTNLNPFFLPASFSFYNTVSQIAQGSSGWFGMDKSIREDISSAKAVLLGALASGVNGQTWFVLKITFLMLGVCLAAMLGLAFSSSDSTMMIHVLFLVLITGLLFFLLNVFLAQTGLVSVEQQLQEMGMMPKDCDEQSKKGN